MKPNFWSLAIFVALLAVVTAVLVTVPAAGPAFAESSRYTEQNHRSFNPFRPLLRLFGVGEKKAEPPRATRKTTTSPRRVVRPVGAPPPFKEMDKNPNAAVVLVVGDGFAKGVANALAFTLAEKPMVKVDRLVDGKKGLFLPDVPTLGDQIRSRIRGENVRAVVVMLGSQDADAIKPLEDGNGPGEAEREQTAYRSEVRDVIRAVRSERKPLIWVGLPPVKDDLVSSIYSSLNDIYSSEVTAARGRFVDLWEVFQDDNGNYAAYGPDVDGNRRRLRAQNGHDFTWDGNRKASFFVERELSRILGGFGGMAFEGVSDDPNFIVLTGRTSSPESILAGDRSVDDIYGAPEPNKDSLRYRFFVKGEPLAPVAGRVDDVRSGMDHELAPTDAAADMIRNPAKAAN